VGSCIALITLFHFFTLTNFFWMLVEGLYLYMLVVKTFSGDNLRFNIYASIGWGKCECPIVCASQLSLSPAGRWPGLVCCHLGCGQESDGHLQHPRKGMSILGFEETPGE